ncbi:MAG: rhodanese-like domain-containing protein [Nitrospirae bacterium]|nr:rhodanese-like domain-containing protein [Nitrospirota bacterium]
MRKPLKVINENVEKETSWMTEFKVERRAQNKMKKFPVILFVIVFLFTIADTSAAADDMPTPAEIEGVKILTTDEVKAMLGQKGVYIFDMRKVLSYGKGHLKGAISLPFTWILQGEDQAAGKGDFDLSQLPQDKRAQIIFHSDGPNGWKSYYHAARVTKEAGYKNVMWYRDGFEDWSQKGYPLEH